MFSNVSSKMTNFNKIISEKYNLQAVSLTAVELSLSIFPKIRPNQKQPTVVGESGLICEHFLCKYIASVTIALNISKCQCLPFLLDDLQYL